MTRVWLLGLVAAVALGALFLPAVAVGDAQSTTPPNGSSTTGFDEARFVVTVYENGSARWTQRYNQPLANESEISRFRAYADRFESEETPVYTDFKERAMSLTAEGSNATGRTMNARAFSRDARVSSQPDATGVVEMSFMWTNFTTAESGYLVGDSFDSGLYLSRGTSIEFRAGPGLEIDWDEVAPTADASTNGSANTTDSLTYFGPAQFAGGHPRVAFTEESALSAGGDSLSNVPLAWVVAALAVVAVLGAVAVGRSDASLPFGDTADGDEPADATATDAESERTADEPDTPQEPAVSPADLRSDADRIEELLEANGGRMQQADIVDATDWSKSKVSTLLSEMAEEGRVSKLRVGRENIVSLAGHEPDVAGSPFEDG
ncbi:helix-turn-helix transcriptional regulator [Halococcus sp. AFM35]|uniref:helix-turn-helix transcriptional regulator n=1 Tax=Halococcus sp. AFM35 TaxID=3421653 RepID=UPI003EB97888